MSCASRSTKNHAKLLLNDELVLGMVLREGVACAAYESSSCRVAPLQRVKIHITYGKAVGGKLLTFLEALSHLCVTRWQPLRRVNT